MDKIVSCFTARLLKIAGYDLLCTQRYWVGSNDDQEHLQTDCVPANWNDCDDSSTTYYSAPTEEEVDEWLQIKRKEQQKKLLIEIMETDAKNGLYDEQPKQTDKEQLFTEDDLRETFNAGHAQGVYLSDYRADYHRENFINQLKQRKSNTYNG